MIEAGMAWMQQHAPEKLPAWLGQNPIGRVLSKSEQGDDHDPHMRVIHFPAGHPPAGTNLYRAPQASSEALQVLRDLRTELAAALQAGKIAPDAISTDLGQRMAGVLAED